MNCRVNPPKTVSQWVSDGGKLWEAEWAPTDAPTELVSKVEDAVEMYILDRRIGVPNDARFQRLWDVNLIANGFRFWRMFEGEEEYIKAVDFLNTHNIQRTGSGTTTSETNETNRGTGSTESTGSNTSSTEGTNDSTTTYGRTDTVSGEQSVSGNGSTTYGRKDTTTNADEATQTGEGKARNLTSDMPHSNVASQTAGLDTAVKWTYATALADTLNETSQTTNTSGTSTSQASGSDTTENSTKTTNSSTSTAGGTDKVDNSSTMSSTGSSNTKTDTTTSGTSNVNTEGSESHTETVTETGPAGEMLSKWYSYLLSTPSPMKWLLDKIEPLLYGFYDDYEEA